MSIVGTWDVTIKTPIGSLAVEYRFTGTADGVSGTATYGADTVPLSDITIDQAEDGVRATWRQTVNRPMRLNLRFDVTAIGDHITGRSRAGKLPPSAVTGTRRSDD